MPSNKSRLYVALYARGGAPTMPGKEDMYHWALLVGPKIEAEGSKGLRFHAKERFISTGSSKWVFEQIITTLEPTTMILCRIMVAKVEDNKRLIEILKQVPIRQGEKEWNCVQWVKEALEQMKADGKVLGTSVLDWSIVRDGAMDYCQSKKDHHRFDGKGNFDATKVATYDLLEKREIVS